MKDLLYLYFKTISKNKKNIFYLLTSYGLFRFYQHIKNKKNKFVEILYLVPYLNKKIKTELAIQSKNLEIESNYNHFNHLPLKSQSKDELFKRFENKSTYPNKISGIVGGGR